MRSPCLFGMITTSASTHFTAPALDSLVRTTNFVDGDEILVIVNDGRFTPSARAPVSVISNSKPLSFAENANQILAMAGGRTAVILNNDLVFTPEWVEPLLEVGDIASPFSNNQIAYETPRLKLRTSMKQGELMWMDSELDIIAKEHAKRFTQPLPLLVLPFFCVAISPEAQVVLGGFDTDFSPAGGEDFDYCLRANQAGIRVQYAPRSFVLHFGGGSTWAGPEAEAAYRARAENFIGVFRRKWGDELTELVFSPTMNPFSTRPDLAKLAEAQDFAAIIKALAPKS